MKKAALLLFIALWLFYSCQSQGEEVPGEPETPSETLSPSVSEEAPPPETVVSEDLVSVPPPENEENEEPENHQVTSYYESSPAPEYISPLPSELPLPEYPVEFYEFTPLGNENSSRGVDLAKPVYREPAPAVAPTTVREEPVTDPVPEPTVVKEPSPEESLPADEPETLREERFSQGLAVPLILEGTDWVYMGEENREDPGFQGRKVLTDRTIFTFLFPNTQTYLLLFHRQDNSSGESEEKQIRVIVEPEPTVNPQSIDSSDESLEEGHSEITPEPLMAEETGEAEARLEQIEENPEKAEESLELLEFLVNVESDNDTLAGYYYRMARLLEMNSLVKDLNKAYEIYEYIAERFFLTDYYELAEERIRFLDRHFFKLR